MGNRIVCRRGWIESVKDFQSLSQEEKDKYCSNCGCEGGCSLCDNIYNIDELDIIDDKVFDEILDNLYENLY